MSRVIDYVDGNLDRSEIADVSDADIARIDEARHAVIPSADSTP
ncbi:MAG: hypothetical protein ACLS4Z_05020 [Christensenellaceae bacterium]